MNVNKGDLPSFALGQGNGSTFCRALGLSRNFREDIVRLDEIGSQKGYYLRTEKLPPPPAGKDSFFYDGCCQQFLSSDGNRLPIKLSEKNPAAGALAAAGMLRLERFCRKPEYHFSENALHSILILSMYWTDCLLAREPEMWLSASQKRIVLPCITRRNEYLFAYFLTLMGFDVLLLNYEGDMAPSLLQKLSTEVVCGDFSAAVLPPYKKTLPVPTVQLPARPVSERKYPIPPPARKNTAPINTRREKSYEELAALASSVVLILIRDRKGDVIGSGSGIMIGRKGYILTNFHVVHDGAYFTVRIENDETDYNTDEVIKYNSNNDLAVIRIDRELQPLPVYHGSKELVRGQKVVAIGSPLGLFNSVSDGIISGMRDFRDMDMIQFTAPISSGSSGGALLNMYGEVIGISTAGIESGQNINLAVSYHYINLFIKGFT